MILVAMMLGFGISLVSCGNKELAEGRAVDVMSPEAYEKAKETYDRPGIGDFSSGLAPVTLDKKDGYINPEGEVVIPLEYDEAYCFNCGVARVKKNDKWGFINPKGEVVADFQYADAGDFSEDLAPVMKNNKVYFINTNGKEVFELDSKYVVESVFREGLCLVMNERGALGFINKKGELVIPCKYEDAGLFIDGEAEVITLDGKHCMIDKEGNITQNLRSEDDDW